MMTAMVLSMIFMVMILQILTPIPQDDHGHGSHCSGTIGAKGNDGKE